MPTSGNVNIQQVLQMGGHTEKLQQTIQQLSATTAQQLNEERSKEDAIKRSQIPNLEESKATDPTREKGPRRKQVRLRKKASNLKSSEKSSEKIVSPPEENQGGHVNILA